MKGAVIIPSKKFQENERAMKKWGLIGLVVIFVVALYTQEFRFYLYSIIMGIFTLHTFLSPFPYPPPMVIGEKTIRYPKKIIFTRKWTYRTIVRLHIEKIEKRYILMKDGTKYRFRYYYDITGEELKRRIAELDEAT